VSRPRIRTLKPEVWADEKIGRLTREARLLFVGLVTMADDAGRFRALPSLIVGHVFPYDDDAFEHLAGWIDELATAGLLHLYAVEGVRYGALPNWTRHQKVNRPTASILPEPTLTDHGSLTEDAVSNHGGLRPPCARTRRQIGSDQDQDLRVAVRSTGSSATAATNDERNDAGLRPAAGAVHNLAQDLRP
jgi:hypothetical protein